MRSSVNVNGGIILPAGDPPALTPDMKMRPGSGKTIRVQWKPEVEMKLADK
jgi:hypothetical protein